MRLIGDIHGQWTAYANLIKNCDYTIQVGDFGLFPRNKFPDNMYNIAGTHKFIRGNHDCPELCNEHPWYLGDYGFLQQFGDFNYGIFYLGGAWTPDFYPKLHGINWWPNEELTYAELNNAIDLAVQTMPKMIITHDCPRIVKKEIEKGKRGRILKNNRTDNALQILFERWQPDIWIFGHHHKYEEFRINGTKFICLRDEGVLDIE